MMKKIINMFYLVLFAAVLTACGTAGPTRESDADVSSSTGTDAGMDSGVSTSGLAGQTGFSRETLDDPASPLANRIIYFDYDKSDIRADSMEMLEAHGVFLSLFSDVKVKLEGHADERGSREYNIALGERRAQAVRRILLLQGASDSQIETVSYGEERPVALGHDESSWERNRRVEIVYQR
jgi:peptidoglycan-associated lipoprotein